jgi:cell volume regulation protein A
MELASGRDSRLAPGPAILHKVEHAHELILVGGALGLASLFAGLASARLGAPLLLVFLAVGMLAGEDGPGGIPFDDFSAAYLIGSIALAAILFEGGLKTERGMLRTAFWPAAVMATLGVAITTAVVGVATSEMFGVPWVNGLGVGAALAPTDAAAVAMLLRRARVAVPERLTALLEVESGLNDPMSVVLMVGLVQLVTNPAGLTAAQAGILLGKEMVGGAVLGLAGGWALLALLRRMPAEAAVFPVLALAAVLTLFGGAQVLGASGFLAVYLMGVLAGTGRYRARPRMVEVHEAFAWLAQVTLFLMLGLLVTPHLLVPHAGQIIAISAVLIVAARPLATFPCLLPFGFTLREASFASWVGLRGAVPIYLTTIPVLAGARGGDVLFGVAFGVVVTSLVVQGWTIGWVGRRLGFAPS